MLARLTVENYALITHVDLTLDPHLNILTGETGAGKSILIDAVGLLLGHRANLADIRPGADHALVEGAFTLPDDHPARAQLASLGLPADGATLTLTRQLRTNGKNTCHADGHPITLAQYRSLAAPLISIHGQHDTALLADPATRLALLDSLGDAAHQALLADTAAAYTAAQQSARRLKRALRDSAKLEQEAASLRQRIDDLVPLDLKEGEEADLTQRHKEATHAQDRYDACTAAVAALYDTSGSAHERLVDTIDRLRAAAPYDPQLAAWQQELDHILILIDDLARAIAHHRDTIDTDPALLEALDDRLGLLARLRRTYHMDIDTLAHQLSAWQTRLDEIDHADAHLAQLRSQYTADRQAYNDLCERLHASRQPLAASLAQRLTAELRDLAMPHTRIEITLDPARGDASGTDLATILIAPNPGMPLRPLQDIASGGEMSRIMLALKTILSGTAPATTLIFDEIDTGIGGLTLTTIADKLDTLAGHAQILCVTHAAAIAARSDRHIHIEKIARDGHTTTHLTPLEDEDAIIRELARMSGSLDPDTLHHAARLRQAKHPRS